LATVSCLPTASIAYLEHDLLAALPGGVTLLYHGCPRFIIAYFLAVSPVRLLQQYADVYSAWLLAVTAMPPLSCGCCSTLAIFTDA